VKTFSEEMLQWTAMGFHQRVTISGWELRSHISINTMERQSLAPPQPRQGPMMLRQGHSNSAASQVPLGPSDNLLQGVCCTLRVHSEWASATTTVQLISQNQNLHLKAFTHAFWGAELWN